MIIQEDINMSLYHGMSAIKLEMTDRVPRTEYSVQEHWALINHMFGLDISYNSPIEDRRAASARFIKEWNYDLIWSTLIGANIFNGKYTSMGHAVYASEGIDFNPVNYTLYKSPDQALAFDPWELYGEKDEYELVQDFNEHYRRNCEWIPDTLNMTGIYVTGISGLITIFGWDMLLTCAGIDPAGFGAVMTRYADWIMQYFIALAKSVAPVVMIHDDIVWSSGAFIHPDWYRKYLFPAYKRLFQPLIENGKRILRRFLMTKIFGKAATTHFSTQEAPPSA
jgi:hypothetical protein